MFIAPADLLHYLSACTVLRGFLGLSIPKEISIAFLIISVQTLRLTLKGIIKLRSLLIASGAFLFIISRQDGTPTLFFIHLKMEKSKVTNYLYSVQPYHLYRTTSNSNTPNETKFINLYSMSFCLY